AAEKEDASYTEFLTRLVRAQWHARQEHALEWRIRNAKLPERWSLDTFPFARQPGVNRKQMRTFAELEFIAKKENIVFIGPTFESSPAILDTGDDVLHRGWDKMAFLENTVVTINTIPSRYPDAIKSLAL